MKKIDVGILGVSGLIGQYYLHLLENHPWFEVKFIAASESGSYQEKVASRWLLPSQPPRLLLPVEPADHIEKAKENCLLVFSALPTPIAAKLEMQYAAAGLGVISNASTYRMEDDIPLIIPEINAAHLKIIDTQRKNRGYKGFIISKPNCALQSFLLPLTPLHHRFNLQKLHVTTLQALSGAGLHGPSGLSITNNIFPYIEGEEEKIETEPLKILGTLANNQILPFSCSISSHCNRVPVIDGHLTCISAEFEKMPSFEEILQAWKVYNPLADLPFSPSSLICYREEPNRPQQRLDVAFGNGMSVTVGRLRKCPIHHIRFTALSHNAIRGGAGGAILTAELLVKNNWL